LDGAHSMRIRVAQMWAGNKWGTIFIPRIGMEVIVDFIEGDPDQPICVGCVYNADNMPPYDLPGEKNLNGFKSDSTVGGGGYNEYVFDDTKGEELIRQHAQKDMHTKVLNNETREVDANRTTTIGNDEGRDVGNDEAHTIGNDSTYHIKNNESRTIDSNHETMIGGNEDHNVSGKRTSEIASNDTLNVQGKKDTSVLQAYTMESMQKIELKVGASKIVIDHTGIKLEGLMIEAKAQAMLKTSAPMAEHKGFGMMTIKGGLVMIN
ncbi:MAG: type VI secretion system tip protein VgrG, partial [Pseudomonadota bacterium]